MELLFTDAEFQCEMSQLDLSELPPRKRMPDLLNLRAVFHEMCLTTIEAIREGGHDCSDRSFIEHAEEYAPLFQIDAYTGRIAHRGMERILREPKRRHQPYGYEPRIGEMYYEAGISVREIAAATGMSKANVERNIEEYPRGQMMFGFYCAWVLDQRR